MEQQLCSERFLMRPSSSSINAVDEVLEEVAAATTTILFCPDVVILCYEFIQRKMNRKSKGYNTALNQAQLGCYQHHFVHKRMQHFTPSSR